MAEGLTYFIGRPAIGVTGAGIAATLLTASTGPIALAAGGIVGLAACGGGWTYLKLKANNQQKTLKKLENLADESQNNLEQNLNIL